MATFEMEFQLRERPDNLPVYSPVCMRCRHLDLENIEARRCRAFPDAIPNAIWTGEHDHRTAFPGDHGIRFEALTAADMAALRARIESDEADRRRLVAVRQSAGRATSNSPVMSVVPC